MGRENSSKPLPTEHLLPLTSMTEDVQYAGKHNPPRPRGAHTSASAITNCAASIAAT